MIEEKHKVRARIVSVAVELITTPKTISKQENTPQNSETRHATRRNDKKVKFYPPIHTSGSLRARNQVKSIFFKMRNTCSILFHAIPHIDLLYIFLYRRSVWS
jgi:hypothetical protein